MSYDYAMSVFSMSLGMQCLTMRFLSVQCCFVMPEETLPLYILFYYASLDTMYPISTGHRRVPGIFGGVCIHGFGI